MQARGGKPLHRMQHAADPEEEVEGVRCLVHQDAAAFACPGTPPGRRGVVGLRALGRRHEAEAVDRAERTLLYQPLDGAPGGIGALLAHDTD
jgi:hypothetical protein